MNSKNFEKTPLRIRFILGSPSFIFLIIVYVSLFWLAPLFVELGIQPKDRFVIIVVVMVTFLIGLFTGKLISYLESKFK